MNAKVKCWKVDRKIVLHAAAGWTRDQTTDNLEMTSDLSIDQSLTDRWLETAEARWITRLGKPPICRPGGHAAGPC